MASFLSIHSLQKRGSKIFVGVLTQKNTRKLLYPLDLNYQETKPK
ncbi:hypothetical protein SAMN05444126_1531, partial [Salisediminibacterium halotolerans]